MKASSSGTTSGHLGPNFELTLGLGIGFSLIGIECNSNIHKYAIPNRE